MIFIKLIFLLFAPQLPLRWEIKDDRKGDIHENNKDWIYRAILCLVAGLITGIVLGIINAQGFGRIALNVVRYTICVGGIFTAIFPYWVNLIHLKNGVTRHKSGKPFGELKWNEKLSHVAAHLSDKAFPDRLKIWRKIGWLGRIIVYFSILIGSIILWFI